jgi:hypothetical protein
MLAAETAVWDILLGAKSQTAATWVYTIATALLLYFVIRQVRQAKDQVQQVENQLSEMRAARDLESFVAFTELWDGEEVRNARRHVHSLFAGALRKTDALERELEFERVIGGVAGQQRRDIDIVINKSNLVGLLWTEHLLSASMRKIVLPYVYKTVIQTWNCLEPYIQHVRKLRRETGAASITFAAPFEELWKEAEELRKSRKEEIPPPSQF